MRMKAQALWSQIYGRYGWLGGRSWSNGGARSGVPLLTLGPPVCCCSDTKNTITAVQTLRNALMTGTFLASTAALLATQARSRTWQGRAAGACRSIPVEPCRMPGLAGPPACGPLPAFCFTSSSSALQVFGALLDPPKLGRVQQLGVRRGGRACPRLAGCAVRCSMAAAAGTSQPSMCTPFGPHHPSTHPPRLKPTHTRTIHTRIQRTQLRPRRLRAAAPRRSKTSSPAAPPSSAPPPN